MKRWLEESSFLVGVAVSVVIIAAWILGAILVGNAQADFRPGASTLHNSTFTGANANVGVHTPIVSTGVASVGMTRYYTSGTASILFDSSALITTAFDLSAVYVTYSAASSTQTLILKRISAAGTEFRNTFFSDAADTTTTVFLPERPMPFGVGDALTAEYGNVNSDTVGVEVETVEP